MSRETKPRDKKRATSAQAMEAAIEILMLEVGAPSFPGYRDQVMLETWCHNIAITISEMVKRKDAPPSVMVTRARKAAKRRLEKEIADMMLALGEGLEP